MRKMTTTSMKKANGGLSCPFCGKFFAFWFGWEKKYDDHVASCKKGNYWLS